MLYARSIGLFAVVVLLAAACGSADAAPTAEPTPGAASNTVGETSDAPVDPFASGNLLLRFEYAYGVPPMYELAQKVPTFSLYSDGSVVTRAPDQSRGAPTLIPALQRMRLSEAGIAAIFERIRAAGMLEGDRHFTNAPGTDDPYHLLLANDDGTIHTISAYSTGFEGDAGEVERALSQELETLSRELFDLAAWLPAGSILEENVALEPERVQLAVAQLTLERGSDPERNEWPLAPPLAEWGKPGFLDTFRCGVIEGDDLARVLEDFTTTWESDGQTYEIYARPLVPDDTPCQVVGYTSEGWQVYTYGDTIGYFTSSYDLVLSIEVVEESVTPEQMLRAYPLVTVAGDGSVITLGPQDAIYPPPALPNLLVTRVTPEGMQTILHAARDAGLLETSRRYTNVPIPDAPTTIFTVRAEQEQFAVSVPALGLDGSTDGLPAEEVEARRLLLELQQHLTDLTAWLPAEQIAAVDEPFAIRELNWVTQFADQTTLPDDSGEPRELPWDSGTPLFGAPYLLPGSLCGGVIATDVPFLPEALASANAHTRWTHGGEVFVLYAQPVLPGMRPCPEMTEFALPCLPREPGAEEVPAFIEHSTGAGDLILRVDAYDPALGYTPTTAFPRFALFGDGTYVYLGAVALVEPGPALLPVVAVRLSEDGIQAVLREARAAGLGAGDAHWDGAPPGEFDDLRIEVHAGGTTSVTTVNTPHSQSCTAAMSDAEVDARVRILDFLTRVGGIAHGGNDGWLPEDALLAFDEPYAYERMQIVIQPAQRDGTLVTWPLADPLATFGNPYHLPDARCGVVAGADLAALLATLDAANDQSVWESDGARHIFALPPRPLLPGEQGCETP